MENKTYSSKVIEAEATTNVGAGENAQEDIEVVEIISMVGRDINDSISMLSSNLSSILENLTTISLTQVLFAMFIAFVGAASAYFFNLFHWKMVQRKQKISRINSELTTLINDFEKVAVDYWIQNFNETDKEQNNALEIVIKSRLRLIQKYIRILTPELKASKSKSIIEKLEEFHDDTFDLVTGDDFESSTRCASKPKAMKIAYKCSDIRAIISSLNF